MIVPKTLLDSITQVASSQPHSVLGMHPYKIGSKSGIVVRAFLDDAVTCEVVDVSKPDGARYPLKRLTDDGFFEGIIPKRKSVFAYRL
ncbi:MAG: 1,4-alpha-glucan branching enzyme, partial [Lentimonas sp.]